MGVHFNDVNHERHGSYEKVFLLPREEIPGLGPRFPPGAVFRQNKSAGSQWDGTFTGASRKAKRARRSQS